jgi:mono/diheme cytochrome c family protein
MAARIRAARAKMRKRMPNAHELVYDNYNFFVIGYSPTEKPSHAIISIAAQAKGVSLCFLDGRKLPDPKKILRGGGNKVRSMPVAAPAELARPEVAAAAGVAVAPPAAAGARPALTPAALAAGRKLFGDNGCGGCHTLADAGAAGVVGPAFDGNAITADVAFQTIHDGRGPMPSFAGALTDPQIRELANYIVGAKK